MKTNGLFITGTDTGVGKTVVTAGLAAVLNSRLHRGTAIWKPVQSGANLGSLDADSYRLRMGSGINQEEQDIATFTFAKPLAPLIAARYEGVEINFPKLVEIGREKLAQDPYLIIEGAGGLAVPLTVHESVATLALKLQLPLIVIARPGLGTVNHTLLTLSYAQKLGIDVLGVIINNYTTVDKANLNENVMMIEQFSGVPVIGSLPELAFKPITELDWTAWRKQWTETIESHVDLDLIIKTMKNIH